jgi:hypothetical protein
MGKFLLMRAADTVLSRATGYVSQYEAELGNLIGTGEYVQPSVWLDNGSCEPIIRNSRASVFENDWPWCAGMVVEHAAAGQFAGAESIGRWVLVARRELEVT